MPTRSISKWFCHLSVRLPIMAAVFIVLAMLVFTYFVVNKETQTLSQELRKQATALADNLAASTASYIIVKDYTSLENILIRAAHFPSIVDIQAINTDDLLLADVYRNHTTGEISVRYDTQPATPPISVARNIHIQGDLITVWQPVQLGDLVGWIRTRYSLDRINAIRNQIWRQNTFFGLVIAIITILFISLYLRKPVHLIAQSTRFADELDEQAGKQIEINHEYSELARLMSALNRTSLSLQEKEQAIRQKIKEQKQLTNELEMHVEERTAELSIARDEAINANRSKSEFLANMSHEIRTPLTAVIGFAESLLDSSLSMEERVDSIQRIIQAGKHLLRVINEILDLSKIEANRLEVESIPFSLAEVFRDVYSLVKMQATEKGLYFNIQYDTPVPEIIHSDPVRFKQILINLCSNGVKFSKDGGITVKVACDTSKQQLNIRVMDTGIGMTRQHMEKLFRPFSQADATTTRQYGGTGLGLYLSKKLAAKLGGGLTVESVKDVGSCFTLSIDTGPLQDVKLLVDCPDFEHAGLAKYDKVKLLHLTGKVLLTEDNPDNQRLVSIFLKRLGLEFDIASNGQEAVTMVNLHRYDLVLMDVQMPIMDGLTATRILRDQGHRMPIIALTANAMAQEKQECYDMGCNDVCTKPIDHRSFNAVLGTYLGEAVVASIPNEPPIISSLLEEEPDLADLVYEFVRKLPDMIQNIAAAYQEQRLEDLRRELHTLKGTGGNFGYAELFDLAKRMEFEVVAGHIDKLAGMIDALLEMEQRIEAGLQPQAQSDAAGRS